MKKWILTFTAVFGLSGLSGASGLPVEAPVPGQGKAVRDFLSGSQVWIEGNSSLHRYYFTVEDISAKSDLNTSDSKLETLISLILNRKDHKLTVTIPVKNMKSDNAEMDKNAYGKLEAVKYPDIVFALGDYVVKPFPGSLTTYGLLVSGKLTIAGVQRDVLLEPTMVIGKDGIRIYGTQDIYQKDYGISPYSVAVVMTTDNKIVVHYMIVLGLK